MKTYQQLKELKMKNSDKAMKLEQEIQKLRTALMKKEQELARLMTESIQDAKKQKDRKKKARSVKANFGVRG